MIRCQYGDVTFREVSFRAGNTKAVLHGPDFLYNESEIHMRCLYSEAVQEEDFPDFDITTFEKLLLVPRQHFVIEINGVTWIDVPAPDLTWGPTPLYANVVQVLGPKKAWVDIGIKFSFRGGEEFATGPGLLLSNRWTATVDTNNRFWETIKYTGEAIFRADGIAHKRKSPPNDSDFDVSKLAPVTPSGKKRENVTSIWSEDGLAAQWSATDRDIPFICVPPDIADCEITVGVNLSLPDQDNLTLAELSLGADAIQAGLFGAIGFSGLGQKAITGAMSGGMSLATSGLALLVKKQPKYAIVVTTTVFGTAFADLQKLGLFGLSIILARTNDLKIFDEGSPWCLLGEQTQVSSRERIFRHEMVIQNSALASASAPWQDVINRSGALSPLVKAVAWLDALLNGPNRPPASAFGMTLNFIDRKYENQTGLISTTNAATSKFAPQQSSIKLAALSGKPALIDDSANKELIAGGNFSI